MLRIIYIFVLIMLVVVSLTGCEVLINPSAEINVLQNDTEILSGGEYDFGQILVGESSSAVTFTIESLGNTKLILSGDPDLISVTGDTSDFVIDQSNVVTPLKPGESSEFTITFVPTSEGAKSVTISIANNDLDENLYTIVIKGEGTVPEINVKQGTTDILSGSGAYDFGEIKVGETSPEITFTIENIGTGNLELTNTTDLIEVQGVDASMFTVNHISTESTISPGESTDFTITFLPSSIWDKTATISIENTDSDENPYTFEVKGKGITAPEINVKQGSTSIPSGTGEYDFGEIPIYEASLDIEFTIENLGTIDLELNPSPELVNITGTDSSMFIVDDSVTINPVTYGTTSYFTISFNPISPGIKTATIEIYSNDYNENPYTFTIKGTCITPDINVKQGNTNIASGTGLYDFGKILINNSSSPIVFTIENVGIADLKLSGAPNKIDISGTDANFFTINETNTTTPLSKGSSTTFTITFCPLSPGDKSALISIKNNDYDENPYTFTIKGTCTAPEINVQQNGVDIPSGTGSFDFGVIGVNKSLTKTFTIQNLGDGNLILSGTPIIKITNASGNAFAVSALPSSTIIPMSDATFSITFTPNLNISYSATVSITNNDTDENPYTFTIYGDSSIMSYKFDFNGDGKNDFLIGAHRVDSTVYHVGAAYIFFGRSNFQTTYNASNADVKLYGENQDDYFGWEVAAIGDINVDGFDDVIISSFRNDYNGTESGSAYIFFGSSNPAPSINATNADVIIRGENAGDYFGYDVSFAGDINNDGINDVFVCANEYSENSNDLGCVYVFYGKQNWNHVIDASTADVKIYGDVSSGFGNYSSYVGDINGDKIDDFVISAGNITYNGSQYAGVYVYFGKQTWNSIVYTSDANVMILDASPNNAFGNNLSNIGDINNDGYNDLMINAYRDSTNGSDSGAAYIFFGRQSWSSVIYRSNANVKVYGESIGDQFAIESSLAGDVNKDGIDDLIITSLRNDSGGEDSGSAYIIYGKKNWQSSLYASNADVKIIGGDSGDGFGRSVSSVGDVNGDGIDDIIIGANEDDDGGKTSGCAFIFFGSTSLTKSIDASNANIKIVGECKKGNLGISVGGGR